MKHNNKVPEKHMQTLTCILFSELSLLARDVTFSKI